MKRHDSRDMWREGEGRWLWREEEEIFASENMAESVFVLLF